jgi:DNA gyrase/topoisomerase IV subunit A
MQVSVMQWYRLVKKDCCVGNILTGDSAAASRYIEARLSKFALELFTA